MRSFDVKSIPSLTFPLCFRQALFHHPDHQGTLGKLSLAFAGFALMVLAGSWTVATTGDALSQQTGRGASFVGFTLLAIATSLPEISTTKSAVLNSNYSLAYSNLFGSNAFDIA